MKKMKMVFLIGIVALAAGVFFIFTNKSKQEENLDIALNANNAQEAAIMISRNNRQELGVHTAGMFLTGLGGALTIMGGLGIALNKKKQ